MAVAAERIRSQIFRLTIDGEKYLGIRVSSYRRNISERIPPGDRYGWSVVGDRADRWNMIGLVEEGNEIYAYGPYREGRAFSEALNATPEVAVAQLELLVSAVATMKRLDVTPSDGATECVYLHVLFPADSATGDMPECSAMQSEHGLLVKVGESAYTSFHRLIANQNQYGLFCADVSDAVRRQAVSIIGQQDAWTATNQPRGRS